MTSRKPGNPALRTAAVAGLAVAAVALTSALAGGFRPSILAPITAALCTGNLLWLSTNKNTIPVLAAGLALLVWITFSLLPLPYRLAGRQRTTWVHAAATVKTEYIALKTSTASPQLSAAASRKRGTSVCRLTLNLSGTLRGILLLIAFLAMFSLTAQLPEHRKREAALGLLGVGVLVAALGLYSVWGRPEHKFLWWCFPVRYGHPIGGFINRNHFGFFCAVSAVVALPLALGELFRHRPPSNRPSLSHRLIGPLLLFGFGLFVVSVFLSQSRGAVLALLAGLGPCLVPWLKTRPGPAVITALAGIGVFLILVFWPAPQSEERLHSLRHGAQTESGRYRLQTWSDALRLARRFPACGCGVEGFRTVFPLFKTNPTRKTFLYAENEYIQCLTDTGILGTGLCFALALLVIRGLWKGVPASPSVPPAAAAGPPISSLQNARIRLQAVLSWGGLAAAVVAAVHSGVDFPLRVPVNALYISAWLGLGFPAFSLHLGPAPASMSHIPSTVHRVARTTLWLLLAASSLLIVRFHPVTDLDGVLRAASDSQLLTALERAPTHWHAWYALGRSACIRAVRRRRQARDLLATAPDSPENFDRSTVRAEQAEAWQAFGLKCLRQAAQYNPSNYRVWLALARVEQAAGLPRKATEDFRRAAALQPWIRSQAKPTAPKTMERKP